MNKLKSADFNVFSDHTDLPPLKNPASLCRTGQYRKAARLCLNSYKEKGVICIELAYSLAKIGRSRLSIKCCLWHLGKHREADPRYINVIVEALKSYSPSQEEIKEAIASIASTRLPPAMVAIIGSQINPADACDYFFETCIHLQEFSCDDIKLTQAYKARFTGDELAALSISQDLVAKDSSASEACVLAAELLLSKGLVYEARRFACLAIRNEPNTAYALEVLALCLYREARWKASRRVFAEIHKLTNYDISLINSLITLPVIALNERELPQATQGFHQLANLLENPPPLLGIVESLGRCRSPLPSEFYLPYEGPISVRKNFELARNFQRLSARPILEEIKLVYGRANKCSTDTARTRRSIRSRPSIAFVSRFFSYHSNLVAHLGLIKHLSRQDFHVTVIHRRGAAQDSNHLEVNNLADRVIYLKEELGESCGLISHLDLDILFFTDIGMTPFDSILAMPHLARYQITSWGLPHTTGVQEIDYYLRSSIFADCEDQSEYTERLVDLPGYIGYFSHDGVQLSNASTDYFLIPPDRFLVGCLQSLHKIHPEFDGYLEEIAKIDESILIIISPSEGDQIMRKFLSRIKKSAPTAYRQLCIVQRTSLDDFFSLNAILDLNLDTIYYGAGISFVQAAWCGPPYITQHSNLVRASTVSRSYIYAGVENPPIAHSKDEYIDLIKYYFTNRGRLASLRAEIQTKAEGTIYNNVTYIQSYERLFKNLVAHGGSS
jgi:hypothetical protein